ARLDAGDVAEDAAAARIAQRLVGSGLRLSAARTGRCNVEATADGVVLVDAAAIDAANLADEAVTVATLPDKEAVRAGQVVATVKIIPFAVDAADVAKASALAKAAVRVAPFSERRVAVISTTLPGLKPSVIDKTLAVLDERLQGLAFCSAFSDARVPHEKAALVAALEQAAAAAAEIIIVFGASAITDRRDVIPSALAAAGGRIEHLGMPWRVARRTCYRSAGVCQKPARERL
ncbi:MAG: hypothetical protein NTW00_00810, partial [Hyphomicrobiales bacterium]|nr:hypothetical protein [Hyphomicrobiales bacterium]